MQRDEEDKIQMPPHLVVEAPKVVCRVGDVDHIPRELAQLAVCLCGRGVCFFEG